MTNERHIDSHIEANEFNPNVDQLNPSTIHIPCPNDLPGQECVLYAKDEPTNKPLDQSIDEADPSQIPLPFLDLFGSSLSNNEVVDSPSLNGSSQVTKSRAPDTLHHRLQIEDDLIGYFDHCDETTKRRLFENLLFQAASKTIEAMHSIEVEMGNAGGSSL